MPPDPPESGQPCYGTFGSVLGDASTVAAQGKYRASLGVDGARDRYSDSRSGVDRGHVLLRNAATWVE